MRSIQIEVDEELLAAIAKDKDFRAMEVSEFFRKAAKFFLKCKIEYEIDVQYKRAYSDPRIREEFDREMKEWINEQVWEDWDEAEWRKAAASNPAFDSLKDSTEDVYTL
ncbi:hypothetical protein L0337_38090 [candidate division KSB1 bacterium]|nr:hypothetical protein [candidate division KSB1 bacterium]